MTLHVTKFQDVTLTREQVRSQVSKLPGYNLHNQPHGLVRSTRLEDSPPPMREHECKIQNWENALDQK